jgi:hypothetical protein
MNKKQTALLFASLLAALFSVYATNSGIYLYRNCDEDSVRTHNKVSQSLTLRRPL